MVYILKGIVAFLTGTNLDDVFHIVNEDLAVADMSGVKDFLRRLNDASYRHLADYDLNLGSVCR